MRRGVSEVVPVAAAVVVDYVADRRRNLGNRVRPEEAAVCLHVGNCPMDEYRMLRRKLLINVAAAGGLKRAVSANDRLDIDSEWRPQEIRSK